LESIERKVRESFGRQQFMVKLGATITSVRAGTIEIELPFDPSLTQQNGFIHAGVITSILDSACGYAALTLAPEDCDVLTVEFKTNLMAPAVGKRFIARSQAKRSGRTLTVCTADAFAIGNEHKPIATMLATVMTIHPKGGK
jgi:uncharacterized protein (TIGR00369 family)